MGYSLKMNLERIEMVVFYTRVTLTNREKFNGLKHAQSLWE